MLLNTFVSDNIWIREYEMIKIWKEPFRIMSTSFSFQHLLLMYKYFYKRNIFEFRSIEYFFLSKGS